MIRFYIKCFIKYFFFLMFPHPPRSTLFPYTTLFRSIAGNDYQPAFGSFGQQRVAGHRKLAARTFYMAFAAMVVQQRRDLLGVADCWTCGSFLDLGPRSEEQHV